MFGTGMQFWLIIGIAVVLCPVLVYIAWWALFADRNKHLRRCPRCLYNMVGSLGMRCSECGHIASAEGQMHFRRRRPFIAMAAILSATGLGLLVYEGTHTRHWTSLLPSRVLVLSLPFTLNDNGSFPAELMRRIRADAISDKHWNLILKRAAHGDWRRRPATDNWIRSYGHLIRSFRGRIDAQSSAAVALDTLPAAVEISSRASWPVGVPPRLDLAINEWWPLGYEMRITAQPLVADGGGRTTYYIANGMANSVGFSIDAPAMQEGEHDVPVSVQIARRRLDALGTDDWNEVFDEIVHTTVHVRGTVAEHFTGVNEPEHEEIIRQVFRLGVVKWSGGGPSPVRVRIDLPRTNNPLMTDMAIGARVELLYEQQIARQLDLWWLAGQSRRNRNYGFEIVYEDLEMLRDAANEPGWTMRITGDAALALRAGSADTYWNGRITQDLIVNRPDLWAPDPGEAAPDRPWRVEFDNDLNGDGDGDDDDPDTPLSRRPITSSLLIPLCDDPLEMAGGFVSGASLATLTTCASLSSPMQHAHDGAPQ